MADPDHLAVFERGVKTWNEWREQNPRIIPDLSAGSFFEMSLPFINLSGANLAGAWFSWSYMRRANLSGSNLRLTHLSGANLIESDLSDVALTGTDLTDANLARANLSNANLLACRVHGVSGWGIRLLGTTQQNLIITRHDEPIITVDSLEVAQFIYLLIDNTEIRNVIDTITTKVVLVLGRFTDERKPILEAIKEALRHRNYISVLFDFDGPANRDLTETVTTLARMSRFIIADLTDPRSIPQELQAIVPDLPSVPVQPIILSSQHEYGMFEHFARYPWVLPILQYNQPDDLLNALPEKVIASAEAKAEELRRRP